VGAGGAAGVCFLAAGLRRLAVPFGASMLLVVIDLSFKVLAYQS
jgi:hypothetical protein